MSGSLIPAVQYLRMSTEHQRYSLENQRSAIGAYALERGFDVIRTYADPGRSGLTLKGRRGLQQLLSDALKPQPDFSAILVLDVSRWGRFQDTDQAAHYEFLCRQAGIAVRYCAEPFENDGSMVATIMKHLKRVMAGEYSRELSAKVSRAKLQQARLGFRQGGPLAYGFRRLLVSQDGAHRQVLAPHELKSVQSDRVLTIPGPPAELAIIRRIFRLYTAPNGSFAGVARQLNSEGARVCGDAPWTAGWVASVIRNELCVGVYAYCKTQGGMRAQRAQAPESSWIRVRVGPAIVSRRIFARANRLAANGGRHRFSDAQLIDGLRRLLDREGRLSPQLIDAAKDLPSPTTYIERFGTFTAAYARIGYTRPSYRWIAGQRGYWTHERVLKAVQTIAGQHGYVSRQLLDQDPTAPSAHTVVERFGSLTRCYDLAGCPHVRAGRGGRDGEAPGWQPAFPWVPNQRGYWSEDDILLNVRRIFEEHGRISAALIDADASGPSTPVIAQRFGTLNRCYELAGCPTTRRGRRAAK